MTNQVTGSGVLIEVTDSASGTMSGVSVHIGRLLPFCNSSTGTHVVHSELMLISQQDI